MAVAAPFRLVMATLMTEGRRTALGDTLASLRTKKRFSIRSLARESSISASYIGQLESGAPDAKTGKPPTPSATVLRMLAVALSDDSPEEAKRIYDSLMRAAGHEPASPPTPDEEITDRRAAAHMPLRVITRGIRGNPDIPEHIQRTVIEILELSEEMDRRAREEQNDGQ